MDSAVCFPIKERGLYGTRAVKGKWRRPVPQPIREGEEWRFVCARSSSLLYFAPITRRSLAEHAAIHPLGAGIYPKATVLNRFIAKLIDLFLAAAAAEVIASVGFLAGVAYLFVADGFAGGRSIGKRLIGLQTVLPDIREPAGFRESIIRNIPFAAAQLLFSVPYVGWLASAAIVGFEAMLIIGNEQGRRLGDELAGTQVLDAGRLALPD